MNSKGCVCPTPITKSGHARDCYYSRERVRARQDSRETPADSWCPLCGGLKHPLNQMCFKCHAAANVTPQVGDGFPEKESKCQRVIAPNGPSSILPQGPTTVAVQPVGGSACGATTPHTSRGFQRLASKKKLGQKSGKPQKTVWQAVVGDLQRLQGEKDALKEVNECILADIAEDVAPRAGEENAPGGPAGGEPVVLPPFSIPRGLDWQTIKKLRRDLVGFALVEDRDDAGPMPLKRMYEEYCVGRLVVNPGGTVIIGRQHQANCYHRHAIMSSDDVGVEADCGCEAGQICAGCGEAGMYILVDSIGSFTASGIVELMLQASEPVVYSIQYDYRAARGGHHVAPGGLPEVRWERTSDGLCVEDGRHMGKYFANPADWMLTGAEQVDGVTLCWNVVSRIGDCVTVQFHLAVARTASVVLKDPMNDGYYGDTTPDQVGGIDPRESEMQPIVGPIQHMYSAGDVFYCLVNNQQILVPKQGVGYIALWAAGRPREQRTYADAYNQARQWLKTTRMSTLERADCVSYVVAFGLLRTLASEAKAAGCLGAQAHAIATHNELISDPFAPPQHAVTVRWKSWLVDNRRWLLPVIGALSTTGAFLYDLLFKSKIAAAFSTWHVFWLKIKPAEPLYARGSSSYMFVLLLLAAIVGCLKQGKTPKFPCWARGSYPLIQSLLQLITALYRLMGTKRVARVAGPLTTYCARGRALKDMREGAMCKIRRPDMTTLEESNLHDCQATLGPFHTGLGVANHIPVVARHCIHNDLVAVRNRGICERARPLRGWWHTTGRRRMFLLFGPLWPVIATPYDEWLDRYPGSKKRELRRAKDFGDEVEDYYAGGRRKAFIKLECAEKRTEPADDEPFGLIEGYDPRLIQGCYPEYVNATGPYAHALSKACKGEHGDTTYGPGMNAEQTDDWLAMAESFFDEPVAYVDSDAVRLDASVDEECITVEADLYEFLGADEEAMRTFRADTITHGCTSEGVSYSTPGTVPSGKTTTTVGNTIAVISVIEEALELIKHKAIVSGDDAAMLIPLRLVREARDILLETGRCAGFELKIKASETRCDMEFCSGRWWPANTHNGFAFGPKPGKLLPKLFFATSQNSVGNDGYGYCQAICTGILSTVSHLPVAYEFVERVNAITINAKVRASARDKLKAEAMMSIRRSLPVQPSEAIWDAYAHVYGLSRGECEEAVREIRKVKELPDLVEHYVFDMLVAQDAPAVGDPVDRNPGMFATASLFEAVDWCYSWLAPFVEEKWRASNPVLTTTALVALEAAAWWRSGRDMLLYYPAGLMHLCAMLLHLKGRPKTALALHFAFNATINTLNWWSRRRAASGSLGLAVVTSYNSASRPKSLTIVDKANIMNQIALPQRQRQKRQLKMKRGGPPPLPQRNTASYQKAVQSLMGYRSTQSRGRGKRRGRGRRSSSAGAPGTRATGAYSDRRIPDGLRRMKNCTFEQDEFIGDVIGSTTFGGTLNGVVGAAQAVQLSINPGQGLTFPWLSLMAPRFEKYVFTQLEFYYKHEVSQFATAGTVGKVLLGFDYDAADAPPTVKAQILDVDPHADGMPCEDFCLKVDCREAFNNGPKYVRPGNLPGGADIKTYDVGLLNFAAAGTADGTTKIGELHVRYRGYFQKPVLSQMQAGPINNQVSFFGSGNAPQTITSTVATLINFGGTLTVGGINNNGLNITLSGGIFTPPTGNYLVDCGCQFINGSATTLSAQLTLNRNGAQLGGIDSPTFEALLAAGISDVFMNQSAYVVCNGTDTISASVAMSGTGGGLAVNATIRFVAV